MRLIITTKVDSRLTGGSGYTGGLRLQFAQLLQLNVSCFIIKTFAHREQDTFLKFFFKVYLYL